MDLKQQEVSCIIDLTFKTYSSIIQEFLAFLFIVFNNIVHRYIAVTQPIKYAKHKSNGRVWLMIAVAWLVSGAIGSPIVLGLNNTPDRSPDQCLFNNTNYVIYSSLGSFYIPCIIMMFLYYSIFKVSYTRGNTKTQSSKSSHLQSKKDLIQNKYVKKSS
jgi:hypothetical protein